MNRHATREPELIPAWGPRWDDVTAVDELELELVASEQDTMLIPIHLNDGTMSPAAAPKRVVSPPRAQGPGIGIWMAAATLFVTGSSLVISGGMFAGAVGYLLLTGDVRPQVQTSLTEARMATPTMAATAPIAAPPLAVKKTKKTKKPVRRKTSTSTAKATTRTHRRSAAATRSANKGEDVVEMSISQLRKYLSSSAPAAAPAPAPTVQPYVRPAAPAPAPVAAPVVRAPVAAPVPVVRAPVAPPPPVYTPPVYRAPAPPPVARPAPAKRSYAAGAKVVLFDGYRPLDPVIITVATDAAGVQVIVDGQPMGTAPMTLAVEPGSHKVALASAKGAVATFDVVAGEGDAWCFTTRGSIKPVSCKKLK